MYVIGVIPARYASKRFPGKPLAKILGKTMLRRVYERAKKAKLLNEIIIATDSREIKNEAEKFGAKVKLTGKCASGTDRIRAVVRGIKCDVVVNIQGDEPLIEPNLIDKLVSQFSDAKVEVATSATNISEKEFRSKNTVKVVTDKNSNALYFSRSPIPAGARHLAKKHIGIYAYRKSVLLKSKIFKSKLAGAEDLEQLAFLENGVKIKVIPVKYGGVAVDTPADIKKVTRLLTQTRF